MEPIDPVRYIGNHSSGRMGFALAEEARDRGANVTLIVGASSAPLPRGIVIRRALTAVAMRDAVTEEVVGADVLVMAAAVADYRVARPAAQKIKKGSSAENSDGSLTLHLVRNPDILAELADDATLRGLVRVGFAAETTDLKHNAETKLTSKRLDLLVANDVSKEGSGFGTETNEVTIFRPGGISEPLALLPKVEVAALIWDRIAVLLEDRTRAAAPETGAARGERPPGGA
jgi:phosphopantothenoylcysteine decarboxylase/phosphopantothenate--cysteine ligase